MDSELLFVLVCEKKRKCTHRYTRVILYAYIPMLIPTNTHPYTCACIHVLHIRIHACVCVYIYIYIYTHTYVYMYIYIYIHIHVYTHLYIHTCLFPCLRSRRPSSRSASRRRCCPCLDDDDNSNNDNLATATISQKCAYRQDLPHSADLTFDDKICLIR